MMSGCSCSEFSRTPRRQPPRARSGDRRRPARWPRLAPWALAAVFGLGWIVDLCISDGRRRIPGLARTQRLSAELGVDGSLALTDASHGALSVTAHCWRSWPGPKTTVPMLYVRHLDQLTATPLNDTAGASSPAFSPDGQWVGFFADSKLKNVPATGGAVVHARRRSESARHVVGRRRQHRVHAGQPGGAGHAVSSTGGPPQPLTTLARRRDHASLSQRFCLAVRECSTPPARK